MYQPLTLLLRFCVLSFFVLASQFNVFGQYCDGTGKNNSDEWISNVTFNTINNNSGANGANGYGNYTAQSTTVNPEAIYTCSVTTDAAGEDRDHVFVYFDWNNDKDWADPGEMYDLGDGIKATLTSNITIPIGAARGVNFRMRVIIQFNVNPTGPCDVNSYGEIEDYSVFVCDAANGITLNSDQNMCQGSSASLSITGSIGGKTYQWQSSTDGVTFANIGGQTGATCTVTPSVSTYYRVIITASGCSAPTSSILVTYVVKPIVDAGPPQTICDGSSAQLDATSTTVLPETYSGNPRSNIPDNSTTWQNHNFTTTGLNPTTMDDAGYVKILSVCVDIDHTYNEDIDLQLLSPSGTVLNLAMGEGGTGDNYRNVCFKTTAATAITAGANVDFNGDYRPQQPFSNFDGDLANGIWQLRVRDPVFLSYGTFNSYSVTFEHMPAIPMSWTPAATLNNANIEDPIATPTTTTTYTVTANNNGCTTSDNVEITVIPKPDTSPITGSVDHCEGMSKTYSVTNTGGNSYAWTLTGGGGISSGNGSNSITVDWTMAGTWEVQVIETGVNGCPDDMVEQTVTVYSPPVITAGRDTTLCTGNDVLLGGTPTASGGSGTFTYLWAPGTELSATNTQNPTSTPTTDRSYTLTVTDPTSGCVSVDNVSIVMVTPVTAFAGSNKTICDRGNVVIGGSPTADEGSGSYAYVWTPAGDLDDANLAQPTSTTTSTTAYTVTVTDTKSGCTANSNMTVNVNPAPTGTITSNTPQCDGFEADFDLTANSNDGNGMTYLWSSGNGFASTLDDPKRNDPYPAMNETHTVVITNDVTGCTSLPINHTFVQVERPNEPVLTANKLTFCPGEDLTLTNNEKSNLPFDPVYDYFFGGPNGWASTVNDNNGTITATRTLTGADGGQYWLVTQLGDGSECISDTAFITITVFDPSSFSATNNGPICVGENLDLSVTDGGVGTNYSWTGPNTYADGNREATRNGVIATDAGPYTVNVNNGACPAFNVVTNVQVDVPRDPGTDNTVGICETETNFDLISGLGGTPEAGGAWNDDDATNELTVGKYDASVLGAGSYDFTYTLPTTNVCPDASATVTVDVTQKPIAGVDNTVEVCNTITNLNLFTLLGNTAETGGTWNNVSAVGVLTGNEWDATGVATGSYDFEYTVLASSADCPDAMATITVTVIEELNAGTNTSYDICEDGALFNLIDELNGSPDAGGSWADLTPTAGFSVNTFDPNAGDGPGSYDFEYTVSSATCTPKTATLTVEVKRLPVAGVDGVATICNTETTFDLFTVLGSPYDGGGSWNNDDAAGVLTVNNWNANGVAAGTYNFTYTVSEATGSCADDAATVTITVVEELNAGTNTSYSICEDGAVFNLIDELNGSPNSGGSWDDLTPTTGFSVNTFDPNAGDGPGSYDFEYTVSSATCTPKTATLTVEVKRLPVAGVDGVATICSSENAFDLFTALGAPYDAGGSWNNDDAAGTLTANSWNANGVAAGNYDFSYTVSEASGACDPDVATVNITVSADPNPGVNTTYDVCESDGLFTLLTQLNGSPDGGGSWADLSGTTGFASPQFDPSAGDGPGTYVFEYTVIVPNCPTNSAQLTVESHRTPIAGDDGAVTICNSENAFDLFTALGAPYDAGGTWDNVSGQGTLTGNTWDATGEAAGTYNFTYTVSEAGGICLDDVATVVVTIVEEPNPGVNTTYDVCESDGLFTLLTQLNGSPDGGGSWADLSGTTGFTSPQFDPSAGDGPGTYVFEYTVTLPNCPTNSAQLTVESHRTPIAGDDGAVTICNTENALALFPELVGTPDAGGTWDNVSGQGTLTGSTWDATGLAAGTYNFTYTAKEADGICLDDIATVVVTIVEEANPGINTTYDVCESDGLFTLLTQLNGSPDGGGSWADLSGTTGFASPQFDPSAGDGAGTYIFEYTINIPSCAIKSAQLTVESHRVPIAGDDGDVTICNTENALALFPELGGTPDAGGTWDNVSGQGTLTGSTWDATGLAAGTYNFTYTVSEADGICLDDIATVVVTIVEEANPGINTTYDVCEDGAIVTLINEMNGGPDLTGTWADLSATFGFSVDEFNPAAGDGPGSYNFEYTLTSPTCAAKSATLTINIKNQPYAGIDGNKTTCIQETAFDLFNALTDNPDMTGTWNDLSATGALSGTNNELFDASIAGPGVYNFSYAITAVAPCNNVTSFATITVTDQPDAGLNTTLEICNDRVVDLFSELTGNPDNNGVWTDKADGSGNVVNPATFDANDITAGQYVFRYDLSAVSPCTDVFSILTINVNEQPDAGTNGSITVCDIDGAFDLFNQLGGSPTPGGVWTNSGATVVNNTIFPDTDVSDIYTYTPNTPNQCQVVTAMVDVTIQLTPKVTVIETCEIDARSYRVEITVTSGDPDSYLVVGDYVKDLAAPVPVNGTWIGNVFTSDLIPSISTYTFTISDDKGCGSVVVSKHVDCGCATNAGDMDATILEACVGSPVAGIYDNTNEVFDNGDGLNFILHDTNTPAVFGAVLDVNKTDATFNFIPGTMTANQTYYISAVVGEIDGAGIVDLADSCLSISNRVEIVFTSIPDVLMDTGEDLCFGDNRDLKFTFIDGAPNYTVTYSDLSTSTGLNNTNNTVNKAPVATNTYNVTRVTDSKGCFRDVNVSTTLTVIPLPDISMTGDITYCEGTNQPTLTFDVNSTEFNPYNIVVNDPVTNTDTPFTFSTNTVIQFPATGPGTFVYTLTSVVDGSTQACPAAPNTSVTIVVDPTPVVSFTGDKTICEGDSTTISIDFTTGTAPFKVDYLVGTNPVSENGIFDDPKVFTFFPTASTTYTFVKVTDNNNCELKNISEQIDINVNPLPVLNSFTADDTELCNGSATDLVFDITGQGQYVIDYTVNLVPDQLILNDPNKTLTVNPTALVGSSVASVYDYVVTKITDNTQPYACVQTFDQAARITVYPNPTGKIELANNPICELTAAELAFTFTGVGSFGASYESIGGTTGGTNSVVNASYNHVESFIPETGYSDFVYILKSVTSESPSGLVCTSETVDTVNLVVQLAPVLEITGSHIICQKDSSDVTFNITRTNYPVTVVLTNDNNTDSLTYIGLANGAKRALHPMTPTNYKAVSIVDASPLGCAGTIISSEYELDVIILPTAILEVPEMICFDDTTTITLNFAEGRGGYEFRYSTIDSLTSIDTVFTNNNSVSFDVHPNITTTYELIDVVDQSGLGCSTNYNEKHELFVVPLPIAKLTGGDIICEDDSTELLLYFEEGMAPFEVTFTDGVNDTIVNGIFGSKAIMVSPADSTSYKIVSVTDGSGAFCSAVTMISNAIVKVQPIPEVLFSPVGTSEGCAPFEAMLVNGTDPKHVATTSWDFGDQNIFTSATNPVPHRFILPGSYDVTLTITTNGLKECTTSLTQKNLIVAKQVPVADFNFFPAKPTIVDTRVSFFNQSKYADAYTWFVDDVERSSDEDFSNYFPDNADATYMVKLLAETDGPVVCSDSITYPVHVSGEMFVHVPNAFTPNEDGLNDVFIPVIDGNDYEEYTFEIYTRSGELIFVTNDPERSWDGKHKGTKVSSDLYIWKLAVKSKYLTEKTGYMGQIKLVR